MIWPFRKVEAPSLPASRTDGGVVWAIGDVHGRVDLLNAHVMHILEAQQPGTGVQLILLGDYVDRGPAASQVIDLVMNLQAVSDLSVVALRGNHEELMLDFMEAETPGAHWFQVGGAETLGSYGVAAPTRLDAEELAITQASLRAAVPARHLSWLKTLPLWWRDGDYDFVHAGIDPSRPLEDQDRRDLLWRRWSARDERRLERTLVHGHTPAAHPYDGVRRVNLDTGAYATSQLTAVRLEGATRRFYATGSGPDGIRVRPLALGGA